MSNAPSGLETDVSDDVESVECVEKIYSPVKSLLS